MFWKVEAASILGQIVCSLKTIFGVIFQKQSQKCNNSLKELRKRGPKESTLSFAELLDKCFIVDASGQHHTRREVE